MKYFIPFLCLFIVTTVGAMPYYGEKQLFTQPDGTYVELKLFGDENYMRAETEDGFTVVRDAQTGWICYARLSADAKTLQSTGVHYTANDGPAQQNMLIQRLSKHLDISTEAKERLRHDTKKMLEAGHLAGSKQDSRGTPVVSVSGYIKGLCIVVDFPDEPGIVPIQEFSAFCNDTTYTGYGNKGSLRNFYRDISGGIVDYENVVFGYYHAPHTFKYYDSLPYAKGARMILDSALHWLAAQGFDFSTLTLNPDHSIRAINLMYTGVPQTWAQGMWHHKGSYVGFNVNGISSKDYNCSPANEPLKLAVVAHENGHMIGKWPDTYKYANNTGDDGIGTFDLMCWPGNDGFNPVPPNPLFRSNAGWGKVIDINGRNGVNADTANSMTCFRYINMNDTNEMFLIESRVKKDRSLQIEDQGLTIWHIDRNGNNQTTHHEVFLEHANNDSTKDNQACFSNGFNAEFGRTTWPNSNFYNGDPSGLRVWDISNVGSIMHYKLGKATPASALNLRYLNLTDNNNANGSIEPGETITFHLQALNIGEINSNQATVRIEAIGKTSTVVGIALPEKSVGVLSSGIAVPVSFEINLHHQTPVGTELVFRFSISDGQDSIYITKTFIAGHIITMDNQLVTTCAAVIYDDGGSGSYKNNKTYSKTFKPEDLRKPLMITFQEFETEGGEHCEYDYLKIFDGVDSTAPMIGRWCNTTSPGTLYASNDSGAITLVWHSDEGEARTGFKAIVQCRFAGDVIPEDQINIFPNPGNGLFTIRSYVEKIKTLRVFDMMGRQLWQIQPGDLKEFTLDMRANLSGLYLIEIRTDQHLITRKISLQR